MEVLLLEVLRLDDLQLALGHGPLGLEVGALGEEVEVASAVRTVDKELELAVQVLRQGRLSVEDVIALSKTPKGKFSIENITV